MAKKLLEIAADIVQAQASTSVMSASGVEETLVKTFITLQRMQRAEEGGSLLSGGAVEEAAPEEKPFKSPQDSIMNDKVVCLECGAEMKQITAKHLDSHGLTPREYKKKYGLALKTPLAAKSLTKARSKAAKKRGLPENLVKYQEQRRQMKSEAPVSEPIPEPVATPEATEEPKAPRKGGRRRKVA